MAYGKYKEWLEPDKLLLIQSWRRDGLSYEQIAKNIDINVATLYKWVNEYSEIANAIKKGEEVCIYEVENALYKAALGYEVTETEQIVTENPDGTQITTKRARKRHIPPQLGAICFILKNRRTSKWQDHPFVMDTSALDKLDSILKEAREAADKEVTDNEIQSETE